MPLPPLDERITLRVQGGTWDGIGWTADNEAAAIDYGLWAGVVDGGLREVYTDSVFPTYVIARKRFTIRYTLELALVPTNWVVSVTDAENIAYNVIAFTNRPDSLGRREGIELECQASQ